MTAHTDAVEGLKPCRMCQGAGQMRLSSDGEIEWVSCKVCGHDGKLEYSAAEAIASWNAGLSRTPTAVPGSAEMREAAIEAAARAMVGFLTPVVELEDLPRDRAALRVAQRAGSDLTDSQDDLREIATAALNAILALITPDRERVRAEAFQSKVQHWLMACFGEMIAGNREERNHRFLEEALELVQSLGCSASEAHQLVDYVYGRPVGDPPQEVGGVMVTLAALCLANDLDMHAAGWVELHRIWGKVEQIRAKQAAKPKHSPLPEHVASKERGDG